MRFLVVTLLALMVAAVGLPGEAMAHGVTAPHDTVAAQDADVGPEPADAVSAICCQHLAGCGHALPIAHAAERDPFVLLSTAQAPGRSLPARGLSPRPDLPPPRA